MERDTSLSRFEPDRCPCLHCQKLNPDLINFLPEAFHEECNKCSSPHTTMARFCSFWKHLRLEHIYKCRLNRKKSVTADFRNVQLCRQCRHCPGCRALRMTIERCRGREPLPEGSFNLYFDFVYHEKESRHWVDLYLAFKSRNYGGNAGSVLRIFGDYHGSSISSSGDFIARGHILDDSDWRILRSQLETSDAPAARKIRGLRVIDVKEARVTMAPSNCEYVTLSYVWGNSEEAKNSLQAMSENIQSLETLGGLASQSIPATIKDAMTACQKLGKRYLWVDRLCILQDNPSAMVDAMDQIYNGSAFTIVASANDDVSQGLPGISRTQMLPLEVRVPGWSFLERINGKDDRGSKWESRGLTFQERYFSKQLLFFGKRNAYRDEPTHSYYTFFQLVSNYSNRELSFPRDKVRAFAGVLNRKYELNHRCGMPFPEFDSAVLWRPDDSSKNTEFPSWTWASVRSIEYDTYYHKFIGMPIASWAFYAKSTTGGIQLTRLISKPRDPVWELPSRNRFNSQQDDYSQKARVLLTSSILAWREGCFVPPMPPDFEADLTWYEIMQKVKSQWGNYSDFWETTRPQNLHRLFVEKAGQINLYMDGCSRQVLVHTQTATLYPAVPVEGSIPLFTAENVLCGWGVLDRPAVDYKCLCNTESCQLQVEVLALSVAQATKDDAYVYEQIFGISCTEGDARYFDSEGEEIDTYRPPLVLINIMLVEKLGETSRRIGLGKALLKRWNEARPQFGVVVLE